MYFYSLRHDATKYAAMHEASLRRLMLVDFADGAITDAAAEKVGMMVR
jgi:hypothetical protein